MNIRSALDLRDGQVVAGAAGRRHEYRPVRVPNASVAAPIAVADYLRGRFGITALYVADLDAIEGTGDNRHECEQLIAAGFDVAVDLGLRSFEVDAERMGRLPATFLAGTETLAGPAGLRSFARAGVGVVLSLDLRAGKPIVTAGVWPDPSVAGILVVAADVGVKRVLLLDLGNVGSQAGIAERHFDTLTDTRFRWWYGGGINSPADLERLAAANVEVAIIGTSLFNGQIQPADLRPYL